MSEVCSICGGDCAGANPPVYNCPMAAYRNTDGAHAKKVLAAVRQCAASWEPGARLLGNVRACDIVRAIDVVMKDWA